MYSTRLNTYQTCIIKDNSETEYNFSLQSQKACENLNNVPVHNILNIYKTTHKSTKGYVLTTAD